MVVNHQADVDRKLRLLRFHGIERDAWKRYGKGGDPRYDIRHPGYKYNLTDLQAALGLAQLERLDDLNGRRAQLVARYREGLTGVAGLDLPQVPPYPHVHSWHLFVVKVLSLKREHFLEQLAAYNIGYGLHFPAAHELSYLKGRTETGTSFLPQTVRAAERILSLPLYPEMRDEDVDYVCEAIREILGHG